jgi:hypothetical protein
MLDMLSSRSYLELSSEGHDKTDTLLATSLSRELSPEIKDEPERLLRPRKKRAASKAPEIPEQVAEDSNSAAPDRPVRKRGRPRLETAKDATAIEVHTS